MRIRTLVVALAVAAPLLALDRGLRLVRVGLGLQQLRLLRTS